MTTRPTVFRMQTVEGDYINVVDICGEQVDQALELGLVPSKNLCGDCLSLTDEPICPQCGAHMKTRGILTPDPKCIEFLPLETAIERAMDARKLARC